MRKTPQIPDRALRGSVAQRYGFALGGSALALGLRLALDSTLAEVQPYAVFYLSVAVSAWWAGTGPAALAAVIGLVSGTLLFLRTGTTLNVMTTVPMVTYSAVCACFIVILRYTRRTEVDAASQRALLEAVLEACPAGVIVADLQGKILRMNAANQRLWGDAPFSRTVEEYREWKGWWADGTGHHGRRLEPGEWALARALRGETSAGDIVEIEAFDSYRTHRTMINSGAPVRDPSGRIVGAVVAQIDITGRRRAELELRHRSEQLAALLGRAPIGVLLVDADFRIAEVNPAGLPAFAEVSELIGRDFGEVMRAMWPPHVALEVIRLFRRTLAEGVPHHEPEMAQVRADRGVTEYYDWRIDRLTLPDGRYGVVCYFRDISRQVLAREAIAASETRYRRLFESIDEGFCVLQLIFDHHGEAIDYQFLEVNPAFQQQTGLRHAVGRTMRELVPGVEEFWFGNYGRVATTGQPTRFISRSEAMGRWFDVYAFRIGAPAERRVAVLFNDITARREAEDALALANQKLQTTLNSIIDGLLVLDHEWRYTYFSETAARMLGVRVEDMLGGCVWDLFPRAAGTKFHEGYHRAVASGQPVTFEEYYPEPLNKWIECHCYPSPEGLSVYFHDISGRKIAELELAKARVELEHHAATLEQTVAERTAQLIESVHELESFSYSISHDMRAPLRAMLGYAEILEVDYRRELGPEGGAYVRRISASARRLDQLIQDVLSYSKVSRGRLTLQPVSVEKLIGQLLDENPVLQRPRAVIEIDHPLPPMLAHEAYLAQILSNLLYNAVKFVPAGRTPEIRVWAEAIAGEKLRLHVADNGIGIPEAARSRIFEMFERLHGQQEYEGTGIGLAIVRKAVERMGGQVGVTSEPGQGSVFWIELAAPDGHSPGGSSASGT